MKFGCSIGIFLNSARLICQSMDISKCFRGSLRLRDNESRLYIFAPFSMGSTPIQKNLLLKEYFFPLRLNSYSGGGKKFREGNGKLQEFLPFYKTADKAWRRSVFLGS